MKLGVFTPVFGTLTLERCSRRCGRSSRCRRIEIGTGGWPGSDHLDIDALLDKKPRAADYRKKIEDAGPDDQRALVPRQPAASRRGDRDERRRVVSQDGAPRRAAGGPGRRHVLRVSGRLRGREASELGDRSRGRRSSSTSSTGSGRRRRFRTGPRRAQFAGDHGVKVALEAHPGFIVYNVDSALRLRAGDGPNLGVNFDPSHFFWQGVDVPAAIRALGDAIFHVHAKDVALDPHNVAINGVIDTKTYRRMAERSWLFRSVGWGHDELEWKRIVSALRLAGYDYVMSIEHEDALASVDEGLRAAVDLLSRVILTEPPVQAWWT